MTRKKPESLTMAVIQARYESTRLPGKVLLPILNKPVLEWMLERVSKAKTVDHICITVPYSSKSKYIIDIWRDRKWSKYCTISYGNAEMNDVIGRVLDVVEKNAGGTRIPDIIVDLTGDCPCVDPRHIDYLVNRFKEDELDYISNSEIGKIIPRTWPNGTDVRAVRYRSLKDVYDKIDNPVHKSHVSWNLTMFPERYKIDFWEPPEDIAFPELQITLDTPEDYIFLTEVFKTFGKQECFSVDDVIRYYRRNPHLITNKKVKRKIPGEG